QFMPGREAALCNTDSCSGGCHSLRFRQITAQVVPLGASDPGALVCVDACIQRVEHGQLRTVEGENGVVDGVGCVLLGPVGVFRRGLCVPLVGSLVDLGFDVVH